MSAHCILLRRCFGLACITVGNEAASSHGLRKKIYHQLHRRFPFLETRSGLWILRVFFLGYMGWQDFSQSFSLCFIGQIVGLAGKGCRCWTNGCSSLYDERFLVLSLVLVAMRFGYWSERVIYRGAFTFDQIGWIYVISYWAWWYMSAKMGGVWSLGSDHIYGYMRRFGIPFH